MSRIDLTANIKLIPRGGFDPDAVVSPSTYTSVAAADDIEWQDTTIGSPPVSTQTNLFLHIRNATGASATVSPRIYRTVDGQPAVDRVITVPAGKSRYVSTLPSEDYRRPHSNPALATAGVLSYWLDVLTGTVEVALYLLDIASARDD